MQTQITLEISQLESLILHTHSKNGSEAIRAVILKYTYKSVC